MEKANFEKWQVLQDEFLNGDLDEKEFCKSKNVDLKWFREQLHEAELYEKQSKNLFVELVPQVSSRTAELTSGILKISFREVDFEVGKNFSVEIFRQVLRIVKEVV